MQNINTFVYCVDLCLAGASGGNEMSFDIQWRGSFSHRMHPGTDRELKRSRCSGGLYGSRSDASWVTQLALVSVHSLFGGRAKLRKAEMSFDC